MALRGRHEWLLSGGAGENGAGTGTRRGPMELRVEVEGDGQTLSLPESGAVLVAFMSFAVARGFGAEHPYLALADRLETEHGVRLGPLTTFYEGRVEDAEDAEKLEMAWQDAGRLMETLTGMEAALASDARCGILLERAGARALPRQVAALRTVAAAAASQGQRVRLSYTL